MGNSYSVTQAGLRLSAVLPSLHPSVRIRHELPCPAVDGEFLKWVFRVYGSICTSMKHLRTEAKCG